MLLAWIVLNTNKVQMDSRMTGANIRESSRPEMQVTSFMNKTLRAWRVLPLKAVVVVALVLNAHAQGSGVLREVWTGIDGNAVGDLTNNVNFPNNPSLEEVLANAFEAPVDWADQYGQRLTAYVIPPTSGNYTFWIASDDNSTLFLSTNEQPANRREIASVPEWTASREWTKYAQQQSSPIALAAGQRYYIEALQKEGGGGDNLAVRWQLPSGTTEEPIPASRLQVYSSGPPQINRQPVNATVMEGETATFSLGLVRPYSASYQWQSNQVNLPGATSSNLVISPTPLAADHSTYRCIATNMSGSTTSAVAILYVTPDNVRPMLVVVQNMGATTVKVVFSEAVAVASATAAGNYALNGGVTISAAVFGADTRTILLTTSPLTFGSAYRLAVNNVQDRALTPNSIPPNSTFDFVASEYAPADIGGPPLAGSQTRLNSTAFDITGAGTIGGTSDSFHFDYETRTGNFDVQVRVAAVTVSDPFLQAGLMVRENLNANSRFAGLFTSSAQLGCFLEGRDTAGATATTATITGGFPVNYPQMWLRLQRSAATVTGFASQDGQTWIQLGSRTLTGLPSTVYFGFAVASESSTVTTTARFRDVGATTSTTVGTYTPTYESLGDSSRRTGLVFSEIMYHPPARGDGKNLEFVEVYNARSVFEDLTGWRLSGAIDYRFPDGFQLQAGEFVVIAANPADLQAVYGITHVLGPFTNSLPNEGGTLRLRNGADALRLEVNYSDNPPWPVAADGAGHSLVLVRPSYGEDDPRAWAASELIGGSPGDVDAFRPTPLRDVVINEYLAHTDLPQLDFIELYNHSNVSVDLSGCIVTDDLAANRFRIANGTSLAARGFLPLDETQLGFRLNAAGETWFLLDSNATRVIDAARFGGQENGVSSGRSPDGSPTIRRLASVTLGTANAPWRVEDVVINEIMYNPISMDSDDEYVELHNRSGSTVDLSGWKFTEGISYEFPSHTTLAAGGYLVVARSAARLMTNYPAGQLTTNNTYGDFGGTLRNSGERLALGKPDTILSTNLLGDLSTNLIHIVVSEVTFNQGGRWGQWADGGGSSLELIDPSADTLRPSSWADSNETLKGEWTAVAFTGPLDNGMDSVAPNRLLILMQGSGECAVDDIEVFKVGGTNVVSNPGFESGLTGWGFYGNHSLSSIDTSGAATGTRCLHVRGQGDGDPGVNSIRAMLPDSLANGNTATIRAKVRWIAGWPEVLFRLYGNYLELPARMTVPKNLGSPGQINSRRVANAGPAIYDVVHTPALPRASQLVLVTCRVSDPNSIGAVTLRYRVDPNTTLTSLAMRDDGIGGDAIAGDGLYSAQISGRANGTLVAFRVEAADEGSPVGSAVFPPGVPAQECLVRWGDVVPFGTFLHFHLWNTQATENARNAVIDLDNTWRDATLVYGNQRVIYDAGFRDKGSPWHNGGGDFAATTPTDDPLHGATFHVFGSTGNIDNEETGIRSQLAAWLGQKMGIPYLHAHYMMLYRNGGNPWPIMEDLEQPNSYYAESSFPDGGEGDLYKVSMWFEFDDNFYRLDQRNATLESFRSQGQYKLARYRWIFQRRPNDGTANNFTNIYDLVTAANATGAGYIPNLLNLADIEQWMRCEVYDRAMGNWDAWGYNVGQNMFIYKQPGQRWVLLPWDIDFTFGRGDGATTGLWGTGIEPVLQRMYDTPAFTRMLWRAYVDIVNGPFLSANYSPQIDARRKVLVQNGLGGLTDPAAVKTWIDQRRNYILSQLNAADVAGLTITSNGGNNYTSATPTTTLTGRAAFAAATIEINGVPYPVTWTDRNTFQITVPLTQATNVLTLTGRDLRGNLVPGVTDAITVTYTGAKQLPQDYVVINEIHYNPTAANASFIEIFNRSTTTPFDLSGFRLDGVGYTFAEGALIPPNSYLLLVKDRAAFANAYGQTIAVFDEFAGSLDNGGEHLALVRPGATLAEDLLISDLRYDNRLPWPLNADGLGASLQLIDAAQDDYRVGNWMATGTNDVNRITPGRANAGRQTLAAFPLVWLNEVLPNNLSSRTDNAGDRDPWIELYNSGATAIDLSSFFLTDTYTNLTKWAFPPGTSIGSGQFLLVWADGEPGEAIAGTPHTSFRLNPTNGSLALVRNQGSPATPAVMDYLDYVQLSPDRSFGSYPDGEPRRRRLFFHPTPNATNNPAFPQINVTINEFMARNDTTLTDPADQDYEDWFELHNAGTSAVDLTSYRLTDNLTNQTEFVIPPGYVIPPGGFLLVWADNETGQNRATNIDLHASFKLSSTNGQLGLFSPDGALVDSLSYGQQTNGVSMGLYPDGGVPPLYSMENPTPRAANVLAGANRPPILNPIGGRTNAEQTLLTFTATATDPDAGQTLTFSLNADAPAGTSIDNGSGVFTWTPTETQGPGSYSFTVRVADNGAPARMVGERITVTVTEVNRAPALDPISDATVNEGSLLTFTVTATDPDAPANTLTFSLDPGAPTGAALDPATGVFTWTPAEVQGPGRYTNTARVTDNGVPALSDARTFVVTVNEVNNPPAITMVLPQTVEELSPLTVAVSAADPDSPPSPVRFSFDSAPATARIDSNTGVITWTPTEAEGPANVLITVRVTEVNPPNPSSAITFGVTVTERNQAPVLSGIANQTTVEGQTLSVQASATDADLPPQTLDYSLLSGAPSGATIDPVTGLFTWNVDPDQGAGTNLISVRVADNGPGSLSATQSFPVVVQPQWHAVINEIMYRPTATNAEYVELHNNSARTTMDLSGLRLAGSNLVFNFAPGTVLLPGRFLIVVRNPSAFAAAYTNAGPAAGQYTGALGTTGDTLRLFQPGATPDLDVVLDEVTFRSQAPWPAAANGGGGSLQLVDPIRDNNRLGNWSATVPAISQWQYVTATGMAGDPRLYLYLDRAGEVYIDDLKVVTGSTPEAGPNLVQNGDFESPLGTGWTTTANTATSSLSTTTKHSGNSSVRLVCTGAGTTQGDSLWQNVASIAAGTQYTLSYWYLPNTNGGNLTVRFSGRWIDTLRDILFNPGPAVVLTPGGSNNVAATLPEFPPLRINEVLTPNLSGITDNAGDHEPWIELVNTGGSEVSLDGLYLTDSYTDLTRWAFPAGHAIPAGGYLVVFADAEPGETTVTALHSGFRLPSTPGAAWSVALARLQNAQPAVVDYLSGVVGAADTAVGRLPDGDPASAALLPAPTPGASNVATVEPRIIDIAVTTAGYARFTWSAMYGRSYRVEMRDDLSMGAWQTLGTVSATGGTALFADLAAPGNAHRFYRVVLLP